MPEASNPPPAAPASPPAAPAPIKLQPKINGKVEEIDLSNPEKLAEVQRFYQIGRADELKRDRLAQLQGEMKAKEPLLKVAAELSDLFGRNPAAGKAVLDAYQALREGRATPEQVMAVANGQIRAQSSDGEGGEAPTSATADPHTRAMLSQLELKLNDVAAQLQQRDMATAKRDRLGEVVSTLSRDEFLASRPETLALVRDQVLAKMDAGMSLDEATNLEAQRIRTILGESATAERDRRKEAQEMRTAPPTAGVPPTRDFAPKMPDKAKATSPDRYMKEAWKATRDSARDYARAAMRAMVQGPNQ